MLDMFGNPIKTLTIPAAHGFIEETFPLHNVYNETWMRKEYSNLMSRSLRKLNREKKIVCEDSKNVELSNYLAYLGAPLKINGGIFLKYQVTPGKKTKHPALRCQSLNLKGTLLRDGKETNVEMRVGIFGNATTDHYMIVDIDLLKVAKNKFQECVASMEKKVKMEDIDDWLEEKNMQTLSESFPDVQNYIQGDNKVIIDGKKYHIPVWLEPPSEGLFKELNENSVWMMEDSDYRDMLKANNGKLVVPMFPMVKGKSVVRLIKGQIHLQNDVFSYEGENKWGNDTRFFHFE